MPRGPLNPLNLAPATPRFTINPNGVEITYFSSAYPSKDFYGPAKPLQRLQRGDCDFCIMRGDKHEGGCIGDARVTGG